MRLKIRFDTLVSKSNLGWVSIYAIVGDVQYSLVEVNFFAAFKCEATINYILYSYVVASHHEINFKMSEKRKNRCTRNKMSCVLKILYLWRE